MSSASKILQTLCQESHLQRFASAAACIWKIDALALVCVIKGSLGLHLGEALGNPHLSSHTAPGWHRSSLPEKGARLGGPLMRSGAHPAMDTEGRSALPCSLPALRALLMLTAPLPTWRLPWTLRDAPGIHQIFTCCSLVVCRAHGGTMEGRVSVWLFLMSFKGSKLHFGHPPQPLEAALGLAWRLFHFHLN